MPSSLILALDQGTSSSRALLLDGEARVIAAHCEAFDCDYPQPGWVEVDPDLLWQTQLAAIRSVLAQAEVHAGQVAAIGITNQRETVVAWDRQTGAPLGPAIVWQCRRTERFCADLRARGVGDEIRGRTGLVVDPYFSASKMRWMLEQWPQARVLAAQGRLCFGTVDLPRNQRILNPPHLQESPLRSSRPQNPHRLIHNQIRLPTAQRFPVPTSDPRLILDIARIGVPQRAENLVRRPL